ncbi:MAG: hypothetical protein AB7O62_00440 [Pirellulales bacterium]
MPGHTYLGDFGLGAFESPGTSGGDDSPQPWLLRCRCCCKCCRLCAGGTPCKLRLTVAGEQIVLKKNAVLEFLDGPAIDGSIRCAWGADVTEIEIGGCAVDAFLLVLEKPDEEHDDYQWTLQALLAGEVKLTWLLGEADGDELPLCDVTKTLAWDTLGSCANPGSARLEPYSLKPCCCAACGEETPQTFTAIFGARRIKLTYDSFTVDPVECWWRAELSPTLALQGCTAAELRLRVRFWPDDETYREWTLSAYDDEGELLTQWTFAGDADGYPCGQALNLAIFDEEDACGLIAAEEFLQVEIDPKTLYNCEEEGSSGGDCSCCAEELEYQLYIPAPSFFPPGVYALTRVANNPGHCVLEYSETFTVGPSEFFRSIQVVVACSSTEFLATATLLSGAVGGTPLGNVYQLYSNPGVPTEWSCGPTMGYYHGNFPNNPPFVTLQVVP